MLSTSVQLSSIMRDFLGCVYRSVQLFALADVKLDRADGNLSSLPILGVLCNVTFECSILWYKMAACTRHDTIPHEEIFNTSCY